MTDILKLRKAAKAVFLATEEDIAHDLSGLLNSAANEIERLTSSIDFDAKRLRRLGVLFGVSLPKSDETLVFSAGSVIGQIHRAAERSIFAANLETAKWRRFPDVKPEPGQICLVAGGSDKHAQIVAVRWCHYDQEFYWYDPDLGLDPYPTEVTTHWMPFPADPE